MAPGHSTLNHDGRLKPHQSNKEVLLPLVPHNEDELTSDNSVQFQLLSTPSDANSPKYKFTIRILRGGESIRILIQWYNDVQKVIEGLNVTTYAAMLSLSRTMLSATPLTSFNGSITAALGFRKGKRIEAEADPAAKRAIRAEADENIPENQEVEDVKFAFQAILTQAMPRQVLARVKRYLR